MDRNGRSATEIYLMRITPALWLMALLTTMASTRVHATANYAYKKHEYPVIGAGWAPNHR